MSFKDKNVGTFGSEKLAKEFAKGSFLIALFSTVPLWYILSNINGFYFADNDLCKLVGKMNICQFEACLSMQKSTEKNIPAPGNVNNFLHYPTLYLFDLVPRDIPNWNVLLYFREMPLVVDSENTRSFRFFNKVLNISDEYMVVKLERIQLTPTNTIAKHPPKLDTIESRIVRSLQYSRLWRIFLSQKLSARSPSSTRDLRHRVGSLFDEVVDNMYSGSNVTESIFDFVESFVQKPKSVGTYERKVVGKEKSSKQTLILFRHIE